MTSQKTIAIVAGEASGDLLGAALVEELRVLYPDARFVGVAGEAMKAAGVEPWWDAEELAVMGLFEVLSHLPRLLRLRRALVRRLLAAKPDVYIGVDAPDFNLGLEIKLRRAGIHTVHYVSPTVWAWREKRVRKIARAADLVLCLFPFEPGFYRDHNVQAAFVGHPTADRIETGPDTLAARRELGLPENGTTIALLPGSRAGEVGRLAEPMIAAAGELAKRRSDIHFVAAMANAAVESVFTEEMERQDFRSIHVVSGSAQTAMAASDVVLCASGTATLEVMLVNRPLVMTYKVSPSTYRVASWLKLVKLDWYSLPNILAGERLVPELIQDEASGDRLAEEAERWLDDPQAVANLKNRFTVLGEQLRCDAAKRAARAVDNLLKAEKS